MSKSQLVFWAPLSWPPTKSGGFKAGDRVFGCIDPSRSGAARQYAIVKEEELARVPGRLT